MTLPVQEMRGYIVYFSARVRAHDVSHKPNPWNGVKFMAPWVDGDGVTNWPSLQLDEGTFDWKRVAFRVAVPQAAQKMSLVLGLELVTGKAWFDDVQVAVHRPLSRKREPVTTGPMYKGHDLGRLRGAMIGPDIDEEGLRVFGQEWNANVVRWQLIRRGPIADPLDMVAYDRWLQGELAKLDRLMPACEKYGLLLVLDLHSPPGGLRTSGGYAGSDHGLFNSGGLPGQVRPIVAGYRPQVQGRAEPFGPMTWPTNRLSLRVPIIWPTGRNWLSKPPRQSVRWIRSGRSLSSHRDGEVRNGLIEFEPIDIPNVVYSVHMYIPHNFTHQNVHSATTPKKYPGEIDGRMWDKQQLEQALRPAIEFQEMHNVQIYIGEFSAIRWAPDNSAYRYLRDVIDIFETHGWDWTYHAYREWDGWSVEHGSDRKDRTLSATPTDREKLLRSWYEKNQKPEF